MQKYALGLYLLLSLSITSVVAQPDELTMSVRHYYSNGPFHPHSRITISKTAFAKELVDHTYDIERVLNVRVRGGVLFLISGIDVIKFTAVVNGVSYPDVQCKMDLLQEYSHVSLVLIDCGSDDIVFRNTFIKLPLESIEIVKPSPTGHHTPIK